MLRRSKRNGKPKDFFSPKAPKQVKNKINKTVTPTQTPTKIKDTDIEPILKEYDICIGCGQHKCSSETDWIECDDCRCWWHCNCAGISNRDSNKYTTFRIKFKCAFCVIKQNHIIQRAKRITENHLTVNIELNKVQKEEPKTEDIKKTKSVESDKQSEKEIKKKTTKRIEKTDPNLILVIDNIENQEIFSSSKEIRKELCTLEKRAEKVKLAYKLPLGGIALHFEKKEDLTEFKTYNTEKIFGKESNIHLPASIRPHRESIGFIRDIPIHKNIKDIKSQIEKQTTAQITKVTRIRYWDTKKPMPIVKIEFDTPQDLRQTLNQELHNLSYGNNTIFVEKRRNYRFIRCFKCQHLGHSSNQCKSDSCCNNCGSESCKEQYCTKPSQCCNCGGSHKSSSSKCPEFIRIVNQRKFRNTI